MIFNYLLAIASVILSLYGCIKFDINIILTIALTILTPIITITIIVFIDALKMMVDDYMIHRKSIKITKKINKKLKDKRFFFSCKVKSDRLVYIKMSDNDGVYEDIFIHMEGLKVDKIHSVIEPIKLDILNIKDKQIIDILHSANHMEITNATLELFSTLKKYNESVKDKIPELKELKALINEEIELLKKIKKSSIKNKLEPLNSYYYIDEIAKDINDEEFLDMQYTENSFIIGEYSEGAYLIARYIFNKLYDIDNERFKKPI